MGRKKGSVDMDVLNVTEELTALDGVSKADVSLEKACAEVEYDESKVSTDKMLDTIKELEYEVKLCENYTLRKHSCCSK